MSQSAKKVNTLLLALTVLLLVGGFVYRYWNNKEAGKIGVAIGETAPEIELPDTAGNPIKLSSLRGNYVLIDFWAAWCKPCRIENPNLMLAYERYGKSPFKNESGFKIFSVSADTDERAWKTAILKDRLNGPIHVSDLNGWESKAILSYGIRSIPNNLLINPEGKVIAHKLHGQKLLDELESIKNK